MTEKASLKIRRVWLDGHLLFKKRQTAVYVPCTKGVMAGVGKFVFEERGFLLVEYLLVLFVAGLLAMSTVGLLSTSLRYQVDPQQISAQEIGGLATRMQKEARNAREISVADNRLILLMSDGSEVSYLLNNQRLFRRYNNGGEVAAYQVEGMEAEVFNQYSVLIHLISVFGERFPIYLFTYYEAL
jgi:type II secretory pathway pseudopilin PulG